MNRKPRTVAKIIGTLAVGAVMAHAAAAYANNTLRPTDCLPGINCLDVWRPVVCSNGRVYSNACYAAKACATGCVPY